MPSAVILRVAVLGAALLVLFGGAGPGHAGSWGIEFDNDKPAGSDRHFTHGTRLFWVSEPDETPDWAHELAAVLPRTNGAGTLQLGAVAGQNMYTPTDVWRTELIVDDHPYAGWLYGGLALARTSDGNRRAWELDLGVVGPASLARQTQVLIHEILGATEPRGWDNQLSNEPGIVLLYEEMWQRLWTLGNTSQKLAVTPAIAASLGNVHTYAAAGASIRIGSFADEDFGPSRIRPGVPGSDAVVGSGEFEWSVFAGAEGRLVGRNIFLDGNSFTDSHSVDKKPAVLDMQVGVSIAYSDVRLTLMHIFRTREFESQRESNRFGVLQAAFRF